MNQRTATFQQYQPRLYGIAYRMLGSQTDSERVHSPGAWLTTTITRLCVDRLRAARVERDAYFGPWLPEPMVGEPSVGPDQTPELASDLSVACLVVLERLAPEERAAFLLHDVFDCGYPEVAGALGKSQAACRQLVHRARQRVRRDRPRFQVSEAARHRLLETFCKAIQTSDTNTLLALFAEDATWTADGGGKVAAASKVVQGGAHIAKLLTGIGRKLARQYPDRVRFHLVPINGDTGVLACIDGEPRWAMSIETDGVRILAGYNVLNPEKLRRIRPPNSGGG